MNSEVLASGAGDAEEKGTHQEAVLGIQIRPYRPSDVRAVRDMLVVAYGPKVDPEPVYDWWSGGYLPNSTGYMVAEAAGRVVGAQPMELFRYADGGEEVLGALLTGVGVHPEFARRGIFTALVEACEVEAWRRGAAFVTTMPNDLSRPGFLKRGYHDLGQRRLLVRMLRPSVIGRTLFKWVGGAVGGLAGVGQFVLAKHRRGAAITIREVDRPADSWIALFDDYASQNIALRVKRDRRWLEWRYVDMPYRHYRFFEACDAASRCVGVLITTQEKRSSLSVAYVMELAVESHRIAAPLFRRVFRLLAADGVDAMAAVVSHPSMARSLSFSGFLEVPAWAPVKRFYTVVRFNPDYPVPAGWKRIAGWDQTLGDWDSL